MHMLLVLSSAVAMMPVGYDFLMAKMLAHARRSVNRQTLMFLLLMLKLPAILHAVHL